METLSFSPSSREKQACLEGELDRLFRSWFTRVSLFGAVLFLLLSPLDYISVPERFGTFLLYRLAIALVLLSLSLGSRALSSMSALKTVTFLAVLLSALVVEVMILQFDGHHSPYYAGMILLAVVVPGFLPAGNRFHLLLAGTIYAVYLFPILLFDEIHSPRTFVTQNYFLIFILGAGVFIRHVNMANLKSKISLNYDTMVQHLNLEDLVRERTSKLVRASDEWRLTFDSAGDMMMLVDEKGSIIKSNSALAGFAGRDVKEMVGVSCFDLFAAADLPLRDHPLTTMRSTGRRAQREFTMAGTNRWFLASAEPLRKGDSLAEGAVFVVRDITDIKLMERSLVKAKEEWERTFNNISEGISIHDEDFNILQANEATRRILGLNGEQLAGRKCYELFHGTDGPISGCPACETRITGRETTVNLFEPTTGRYLEITAIRRPGEDGAPGGIIHMVRDITERKEAIDESERASSRMQHILEMAPFGIFIVNSDSLIEYANPAMLTISGAGRDGFIGSHIDGISDFSEIGLDVRMAAAFEGFPFRFGPVEYRWRDGQEKSVGHFTGIPMEESGGKKVLVFLDDVTSLKRAEEERAKLQAMLLQAQKMDSIGTLAGGIAHDFNNILTAISNYAGIALMKLEEGAPTRRYLDNILQSSDRAAGLTKQLLTFSRKQDLEMKVIDLASVLSDILSMLRCIIGEDVSLDLRFDDPLDGIMGDKGQIEQVILNLVVNARDAMPRGGVLTIDLANVDFQETSPERPDKVPPGSYVRLEVRDSGTGMSSEVRQRMFEPFFTTKEVGRGTGLGLPTVYGIVRQHKGHIVVESGEGKGSTFSVYWPLARETGGSPEVEGPGKSPGGGESILLVDDEEHIRESTAEVLRSLGYSVLIASSAEEALNLAASRDRAIDLMLTDVVMGGMNGTECAREFLSKRPGAKVLLMSGYAEPEHRESAAALGGVETLDKPLRISALATAVRRTLDGGVPENTLRTGEDS